MISKPERARANPYLLFLILILLLLSFGGYGALILNHDSQ